MNRYRYFIVLILFIWLPACSPVKIPEVAQYQLMGINQQTMAPQNTGRSILVGQPTATAGYVTNKMRYMRIPYQLSSFSRNSWVAPPADMLYPLILESLQNTRHFGAVESMPFSGLTDYRLDVKLLKMVQNFTLKPSQIELVVKVTVSDNNYHIIASKIFYQRSPVARENPYGGVLAANKASAQLMTQMAQFVVKVTS